MKRGDWRLEIGGNEHLWMFIPAPNIVALLPLQHYDASFIISDESSQSGFCERWNGTCYDLESSNVHMDRDTSFLGHCLARQQKRSLLQSHSGESAMTPTLTQTSVPILSSKMANAKAPLLQGCRIGISRSD